MAAALHLIGQEAAQECGSTQRVWAGAVHCAAWHRPATGAMPCWAAPPSGQSAPQRFFWTALAAVHRVVLAALAMSPCRCLPACLRPAGVLSVADEMRMKLPPLAWPIGWRSLHCNAARRQSAAAQGQAASRRSRRPLCPYAIAASVVSKQSIAVAQSDPGLCVCLPPNVGRLP